MTYEFYYVLMFCVVSGYWENVYFMRILYSLV
jgi:hypothetical protein